LKISKIRILVIWIGKALARATMFSIYPMARAIGFVFHSSKDGLLLLDFIALLEAIADL
jgi:hypothetical protein